MSGDGMRDGKSIFVAAQDGLRLHVCEYGSRTTPGGPVVCLPGLTRTVADFAALAPVLANDTPHKRRVIAIDSRGRGLSEYDSNPQNYNLAVELGDVLTVLAALEIGPAILIGSSRGGLLTMLLSAVQPAAIAGAVLHDIGPVIEASGLARIKSYAGKLAQPGSFAEGAEILRRLFAAQFPKLTADQWLAAAHRAWRQDGDLLKSTYDIRIADTLVDVDVSKPPPPLWKEFDSLSGKPLLVIRGGNSDILSAATLKAMAARHPDMQSVEIADEGHVPSLDDKALIGTISAFVAACDGRSQ